MKKLCFVLFFTFPVFAQGDYQKGISYYKQGQYDRAVTEFKALVEETPEYEPGFRILGDAHLRLKQYAQAASAFHQAIDLKPENWVSHYGAAIAEYNLKQFQDATATLLRGEQRARSPREKYQLYHTRGAAYYNLGRFSDAVEDLTKAVSIQRGDFRDLLQLGISHFQLENFSDAHQYLTRAAALDPNSQEARRFLSSLQYRDGVAAVQNEDYSEAQRLLGTYVAENPQDGEGWFNLGLARLFLDDLGGAEQAFLRSSELLQTQNWEVYDRLGYIYELKRQYTDALSSYQKAAELLDDPKIQESVDRIQERVRRQKSGQ